MSRFDRHAALGAGLHELGARRRLAMAGLSPAMATTMVQWTGPTLHVQVIAWSRIGDEQTSASFAAAIEAAPRQLFGGGTSISGAIDYGSTLFAGSSFHARRRVIDVSGD